MLHFRFVIWFFAAAGFLGILAPSPAVSQTGVGFNHKQVAQAALERHIRPGFSELTRAFVDLDAATQKCTRDLPFDFTTLGPAFQRAVLAWGRVAHLAFGPMAEENRYERIFFWLDRKGIGRRQMARALRNAPPLYLDAAKLVDRSVAVQGLVAFETLVVRPVKDGEDRRFRCGFSQAIAKNLVAMAQEVGQAWSDKGIWSKRWLKPGGTNLVYQKPQETTYALARSFVEHIERLRDIELSRPLGFARRGKYLPGPFDRSKLTMAFLAARISGLQALIDESGLAAEIERIAAQRENINATGAIAQVQFELKSVSGQAAKLASISDFFRSQERRQAVSLGFPLKSARDNIKFALEQTTDLPMSFNAADGD